MSATHKQTYAHIRTSNIQRRPNAFHIWRHTITPLDRRMENYQRRIYTHRLRFFHFLVSQLHSSSKTFFFLFCFVLIRIDWICFGIYFRVVVYLECHFVYDYSCFFVKCLVLSSSLVLLFIFFHSIHFIAPKNVWRYVCAHMWAWLTKFQWTVPQMLLTHFVWLVLVCSLWKRVNCTLCFIFFVHWIGICCLGLFHDPQQYWWMYVWLYKIKS